MKHLVKNSLTAIILLCLTISGFKSSAADDPFLAKEIPLDRDFLNLPHGRWVWLLKTGEESTRMMLGRGKKSDRHAIWFRDFKGVEYDNPWDYAYFVYLKPNQLIVDLDRDGYSEVGVATYDFGNSVIRDVMIFAIKKDRLEYVRTQGPFNLEADLSLFK